jgi:hypothetical protein
MTESAPTKFEFVTDWQREVVPEGEAIAAFWQRENALGADVKAEDRLRQVVVHARAVGGDVAGVCTAVQMTLPRLGQPMYYYRCFIGKDWRRTRLVFALLARAFDVLEDYARANKYPCIGMVLELENGRFGKTLRAPTWTNPPFIYIGKSGRGLDLRLRYFRGARLKNESNQQ